MEPQLPPLQASLAAERAKEAREAQSAKELLNAVADALEEPTVEALTSSDSKVDTSRTRPPKEPRTKTTGSKGLPSSSSRDPTGGVESLPVTRRSRPTAQTNIHGNGIFQKSGALALTIDPQQVRPLLQGCPPKGPLIYRNSQVMMALAILHMGVSKNQGHTKWTQNNRIYGLQNRFLETTR